jgi:putative acetyltransferase
MIPNAYFAAFLQNHMNQYSITRPTQADFDEITGIWEASVRATHSFLPEEDILYFRPLVRNEFLKAVDLYCIRDRDEILGFSGLSNDTLEMLFVHPHHFKKGIGKELVLHAIAKHVTKVDVNEQNPAAIAFYQHLGFVVKSRSPLDMMGKPYPILHLELPATQS